MRQPLCAVVMGLLAAQALWSCSQSCPNGFRRVNETCEPTQERGDPVTTDNPEAGTAGRVGQSGNAGTAGSPAADGGQAGDDAGTAGQAGGAGGAGGQSGSAGNAGAAGSAPEPLCKTDQYRCAADTLQRCNDARTAWESLDTCAPGKCDVDAEACLVCTPGADMCTGTKLSSCDAQGTKWTERTCAAPTPLCQRGACVECNVDIDCPVDTCSKRTCTAGKCSAPTPASFGTQCIAPAFDDELQGQCTSTGVCAPVIAIQIAARAAGDGTPINQAYLSAHPDDGFVRAAGMNGGPPGAWEPMLLIREQPGSARVQLWSLSNQGYVTPVAPGPLPQGVPVPAAKWLGSRATEPDTFELSHPKLGQQVTIQSLSDTHYWSAEDWRVSPADYVLRLRADRTALGPWEHFTLIPYEK